jgi:type IV fimbrial biogenesis protein FimT
MHLMPLPRAAGRAPGRAQAGPHPLVGSAAVPRGRGARGITLVELMISIALVAILLKLAAPPMANWVANARVRTIADSLQNGVRLAQAEAVRRNRQVVFFLSNVSTCNTTDASADNGTRWQIRTVPLVAGDPVVAVQCGALADVGSNVTITGPRAICFNSAGRQVANAAPGPTGAACTLDAGGAASQYNIAAANSDRPQRVLVALGGHTRMCDPAKTLGAGNPDGCP